jgi:hypothetical protein
VLIVHREPINLNRLSSNHSDEIDQILAGIRGATAATLWTGEMRAAIRGGKVCGHSIVDESETNNL